MRLFIAIFMPYQLKKYLSELQKKLIGAKLKLAENFHLTLKFLGNVPENKLERITDQLKKIKFEPFNAGLGKIGCFPSEDYIRVIFVELKPLDKMMELQQKIENSLPHFPKDKRFRPHVTLARVKFIEDKKAFVEKIKKIKVDKKEFMVSSFNLIKSTLTPEGPVYKTMQEFKASKPQCL